MPIDTSPPIEIEPQPAMHREAPEMPQALGVQSENGEYLITVEETPEQRQRRVEREEKQLMDKATEVVLGYVIRQGLFVDREPEELVAAIQHSELFKNEIQLLIETACEGENGRETTPTSVSPYVSIRTEKDGDVIETVHGFHIQPSATLLNEPGAQKAWKHDYIFDFQNPEVWQGLFPGTEPTLLQQAEADKILSESEAFAKELQDDYKTVQGYYEPTPERMAKVEAILKSMNIDPDEFATSVKDLRNIYMAFRPDSLAPLLINGDTVRMMALRTLSAHTESPTDFKNSLQKLKESTQAFHRFQAYFDQIPAEEQRGWNVFAKFKKEFGDENLRHILTVRSGLIDNDISENNINFQMDEVAHAEKAQNELEEYYKNQQN